MPYFRESKEEAEDNRSGSQKVKEMEARAENLLNSPDYDQSEDKETLIRSEIELFTDFKDSINDGDFSVYESEKITNALTQKCYEDIAQYIGRFKKLIMQKQEEIEDYEAKERKIRRHNENVTSHTYDLEQERWKLGLMDGKRKKEIDKELAKWEYLPIPDEYEKERQKLKEEIEAIRETFILPYTDVIKGIFNYMDKAKAHFETIELQRRKYARNNGARVSVRSKLAENKRQLAAETPQKPQKAVKEPLPMKETKEVHKPDLKPLKWL